MKNLIIILFSLSLVSCATAPSKSEDDKSTTEQAKADDYPDTFFSQVRANRW